MVIGNVISNKIYFIIIINFIIKWLTLRLLHFNGFYGNHIMYTAITAGRAVTELQMAV